MDDLIDDLKARARILQRKAQAGDEGALARLRRLPDLKLLDDGQLRQAVQRRHCLTTVAREQGFRDWSHARAVLTAEGAVADFGTLLYPARCSAHWNIWSADYDEARTIRDEHGGYLLAYRHQFLIVDRHYLETLGLDPDDVDWERMGRDWVRPAEPQARSRLYAKLLLATHG